MSTTRSYSTMLNEYTPESMLVEEMIKRDWFFSNVHMDNSWKGGSYIVPFEGASASSIKFGSLTASNDIAEYQYVRGSESTYQEVWGALIFNHRDLQEHNGRVNEASFLKVLPGQIDSFLSKMKEAVSTNLLCGPHFAKVTVDGTVGGVLEVDHVDRFVIGQKFTLDDNNSAQVDVYVIAINVNGATVAASTGSITVSLTRGGAAADVSAYAVANLARCYHDGVLVGGVATNHLNSVRDCLLSLANGGSANIHGVAKLAWPHLQAVNVLGSGITAANILPSLFDAYGQVRARAKGNASTFVMSYKHLGSVMKAIELTGTNQLGKGAFKVSAGATKASVFGWTEIDITSVKGNLKIVGIQEMDDDVIFMLDMKAFKFATNGLMQKRTAPDGKQFHEIRNTSGFQYITDIQLFGQLICTQPGSCGVIYSISY